MSGRLGVWLMGLLAYLPLPVLRAQVVRQIGIQRLGIECQCAHGRLLKNCSRMMQAAAASASRAPIEWASVVV